jgi:hypothetical protein
VLPLPNLDDRMFEQMLQEARKAIPRLFPQWTDENAHDPGMTLLELMSWMTEMQQYYLNRVTEQSERKFLKLLGVKQKEASSAICDVIFSNVEQQLVLPQGTPLTALDQRFETLETLRLIPAVLEKTIVRTESVAGDFTSNNHAGIAYYAFGPDAKKGSKLYIGFDRSLPEQTDISISLKLFEDYPVPVAPGPKGEVHLVSSAEVSWSYASSDDGEGWMPAQLIRDHSVHLSQSGEIIFRISSPMKPFMLFPADDKRRYWICCTLEREGYELPPKMEKISLNSVQAQQMETFSEIVHFDSDGEPELVCELISYLAFTGQHLVQVQDESGAWQDWRQSPELSECGPNDRCCAVSQHSETASTRITFGEGTHGSMPPPGRQRIRVISFTPEFASWRWLGNSDGLPGQTFEIQQDKLYQRSSMQLQVSRRVTGQTELIWEDWQLVDDFDNSTSSDRHYRFHVDTRTIEFGNNEAGLIPFKSVEPNIRFISLQAGGGMRGNIKNGMMDAIDAGIAEWDSIAVTNPFHARGGSQPETLEEAKMRVQRELDTPYRAVTSEDYEAIAAAIPGLRVARVKAIPLYKPGMRDFPRVKAPAQMTVVVVPYSENDKPKASKGFLQTVQKHLDAHRLLTTELHVMPAVYIRVTVHAIVVVEPQYKEEASRILRELKRLLQPMGYGDGSQGWRFGRTVYKGDIYGVISRLKGIVFVQDLWMDAEGQGSYKDPSGDIHIPPYGLVYSGDHEVELVSQTDL